MNISNITLSFFDKNLERTKDCFLSFLGKEYHVQKISNHNELFNYYRQQEYTSPNIEFVIFSPHTNPQTSVMFANIMDGYVNLIKHISKQFNLNFYHFVIQTSSSQMLESYQFHYYSNSQSRHVLCYQDPQWVFYEEGMVLPFEDISLYKQRIKKSRLNENILLQYLRRLGWNIEDNDFWNPSNNYFYLFMKKQGEYSNEN